MKNYKAVANFCGIDHEVKFACEPAKLDELIGLFLLTLKGSAVNIVDDDSAPGNEPLQPRGREFI